MHLIGVKPVLCFKVRVLVAVLLVVVVVVFVALITWPTVSSVPKLTYYILQRSRCHCSCVTENEQKERKNGAH